MARFRFKLERLLHVRAISEELARAELAATQLAAAHAEAELELARTGLANAEHELGLVRSRDGARAALAAERTLPALLRRIVSSRKRLEAAQNAAAAARSTWQARRTNVRALEKLEERARGEFTQLEREREARALQETIERRAALEGRALSMTETEQ